MSLLQKLSNFIAIKLQAKNSNYLILAVFAVLILLFYGNTLFNGFVHDDIAIIVQNEYVQSLVHLPRAITGCILESALGDCTDSYYRPIQSLSYLLSYQISSSSWFFHLVNLLYFLSAAFLIFILVQILTKDSLLAFLTSLFFIVHPINNEVVNWIAAVPELSSTIFILLATIFYIRYSEQLRAGDRDVGLYNKNLLLVFLFYFLGMFSKEPVVFLPIIFVSIDLFLFRIPLRAFFHTRELARYAVFSGLFFIFFTTRALVIQGIINAQPYYQFTIGERIYSFFELFPQYLFKLVYPYPLLFFYPFEKNSDLWSLQFLFYLIIFIFFTVIIYVLLKKRMKLHALFLIWILVFLFPVLIFLNSLGENTFSERYLFVPSIGFAFLLSSGMVYLFRHPKKSAKPIALLLIVFIVGVSWFLVYPRNQTWKDNDILFTTALAQNPDAHPLRFDYAVDLGVKRGNFEAAKKEFEEIERRNPNWVYIHKVYSNIADVYKLEGNKEQAIVYYQKSIESSGGQQLSAYNNIGVIYVKDEEYLKALPYFCTAAQINPEFRGIGANLNKTISILQSQKEENPELFYEEIISGESFRKASIEKVRYTNRECSKETCSFFFVSRFDQGDVVLPFLIQGATDSGEIVLLNDPAFDQQTGAVKIDSDAQYAQDVITFIFPTCDGVYYEAETATEP